MLRIFVGLTHFTFLAQTQYYILIEIMNLSRLTLGQGRNRKFASHTHV